MAQLSSKKIFTEKSKAYAKYRAGYPEEAIDVILKPFKNKNVIQIVDIGAGTGIASRLMADREFTKVTAIEPNAAMIEFADPHPSITFKQASAEETYLEDDFADVVTSFQAFHWFNFTKSLKEFNRILKPSGQLALIWNYWDITDPFTASYVHLIDQATQKNLDRLEPYAGIGGKIKKGRIRILWKFQRLPYYKNVERHTFRLVQPLDLEGLIGCTRSQSFLKHEGPVWDDLIKKIEKLYQQEKSEELVYSINVFTAKPKK